MPREVVRVKWHGRQVTKKLVTEIDRRLRRASEFLKSDIQRSMRTGGEGGRRRSKPGEVPYVQTGKLRQSIFVNRVRPLHYEVGTNLDYGVFHELGIRYPSGFQQRPFIRPAVKRNRNRLKDMIIGRKVL